MLQNLTVKLSNLPCLEKILLLSTFCFINSRLVYFFKLNSLTSAMKKSHKSSNEIKFFILHTNQEIEIMRQIFYNDMLGFYLNRSMRNRNWLCSFQKEQKVFMQIYWGCQGAHPVKSHEITKKPWLEICWAMKKIIALTPSHSKGKQHRGVKMKCLCESECWSLGC